MRYYAVVGITPQFPTNVRASCKSNTCALHTREHQTENLSCIPILCLKRTSTFHVKRSRRKVTLFQMGEGWGQRWHRRNFSHHMLQWWGSSSWLRETDGTGATSSIICYSDGESSSWLRSPKEIQALPWLEHGCPGVFKLLRQRTLKGTDHNQETTQKTEEDGILLPAYVVQIRMPRCFVRDANWSNCSFPPKNRSGFLSSGSVPGNGKTLASIEKNSYYLL